MPKLSLSELVDLIYEAALEPARWAAVMDAVADQCDASIGNLSQFDWVSHESVNVSRRVAAEFHQSYTRHFASRNPLMQPTGAQPVGRVVAGEALIPRSEWIRTEIYNDWFAPQGMEFVMGVNLGVEGTRATALGVWRRARLGAFGADARQRLALIAPHLRRALKISARLAQTQLMAADAEAAINQLTHGVVVLDHAGRSVFLNRLAEDLIAARDGIGMLDGVLVAARSEATCALRAAIRRAATSKCGSSLPLERPSGKRPLMLLIAPLNVETAWFELHPSRVLVLITDPVRGGTAPKQRLVEAYRLTPTEATLVMGLLSGHELKRIADDMRISYETARTHFRHVLIKTGTHRQADLVRLLVREVGGLR